MKATKKVRRKLNTLGKVVAGGLSLIGMLLLFLLFAGYDSDVEAERVTAVINSTNSIHNEHIKSEEPTSPDSISKTEDPNVESIPIVPKEQPDGKIQPKSGNVVYLTFDDGPSDVSLDILRLLDRYNAKGTFFMLEPNMRKHPDSVKAIAQNGHSVGVHGVSHNVKKIYHSPESFISEMIEGISCVKDLTGIETKLVRAPYGSKPYITPSFKTASDSNGFLLWDWNIDSMDWKLTDGEYVEKVELQSEQLTETGKPLIVLLHDKPSTLEHLEKLLKYYQNLGFEMLPLDSTMTPIQF